MNLSIADRFSPSGALVPTGLDELVIADVAVGVVYVPAILDA
jgi:hypothetical protein